MKYGLQLFSVRDVTEKDLEGALKAVAEMGYSFVEFAGFFGHSAEEVKGWLDKYGLTAPQVGKILSKLYPSWDGTLYRHYLDKFGLAGKKQVKAFSKGMKMKLSLAAAFAARPRLLILDEATSGLDPVVRDEILDEFLAFIQDEEHAVLLSSHITSDLEKAADYITYLHKGKVAVSGAKDELLDTYGKLVCSRADLEGVDPALLAGSRVSQFGCEALVKNRRAFARFYPHLTVDPATLEDIMVFTGKGDAQGPACSTRISWP